MIAARRAIYRVHLLAHTHTLTRDALSDRLQDARPKLLHRPTDYRILLYACTSILYLYLSTYVCLCLMYLCARVCVINTDRNSRRGSRSMRGAQIKRVNIAVIAFI